MSAGSEPIVAPRSALGELRLVLRQVGYEQLTFWLNPVGAIFTVGFSVLFVVMLGASAGSSRVSYLHNVKLVQYYVPGFIAYGVMSAAFNNLAISVVIRRESGLLKRLRLSPLPTWTLLSSILLSTLLIAFAQVVLLLAVGRWAFGVHPPAGASGIAALIVVLVLGGLSFAALGIAMSTLIPNQQAAGPLTSTVFFVLLFLSGLWFPLKSGSTLAKISTFFPIRHFITAVFRTFSHPGASAWAGSDLLIVVIWGAVAAAVALRRFQWAPLRT
ncbi:MAG: ABC transporter permease [Solirubrobacterales bacterium]|nr:ABC transporter permease [Solirubrobacterales bacterium]